MTKKPKKDAPKKTKKADKKSEAAETPQKDASQTGAKQQQQIPGTLPVQILAQYIKDFSFENPNSPASIVNDMGQPQTSVQVNVQIRDAGNDLYEVILLNRIESRFEKENKTAFVIELAYACLASLNQVPKQNHEAILKIEVPRLIFPFAREAIANTTMRGGYPPLWLQPVNFEALYLREKQQAQQKTAEQKD